MVLDLGKQLLGVLQSRSALAEDLLVVPLAGPSARVLPRLAVLLAVSYLVAYAAGLALLHDPSAVTAQSDLVYAAPAVVGTALATWAARRWWRRGQRRAAAGWGWLAGSCGCLVLGDAIYAGGYYLANRPDTFPGPADGPWLLSDLALLPAVVLAFAQVSPLRRLRAALDALVALLGLGAVLWTLVLAPELSGGWTLGAVVTAAYPLVDLAVLVTLLSVGLSGHRDVGVPVLLLGAGALLLVVTDLVSAYASNLHSYIEGSWCDLGWQGTSVVLCLAALAAGRCAGAHAGDDADTRHRPVQRHATSTSSQLLVDREALSLVPLLVGVSAVLTLVGVQAVGGGASGPSLALAAGTVVTVVVRLLLSIADQRSVSRSLDVALAEQQRLAITDTLTELYNRRFIEELLGLQASAAARTGRMLAVLLIDLDHFKAVNDTYGHQAGDAVLAEAAVRLRRGLRDADVLGRWGGEEFLAVLSDADGKVAADVADRVRDQLRSTTIRLVSGERLTVTASVGVAVLPVNGTDLDLLLREADQALYLAKDDGRDRTRVAGGNGQAAAVL